MRFLIIIIFFFISFSGVSQSILGKWRTVDDETGEEKSIVEIYKKEGKIFGKIVEIFDPTKRDLPCKFCKGDDYNQPILGLDIIKEMEMTDDNTYKKGTITDPQDGKIYTCRLKLEDKNTLQVRGYITLFYATQYWKRATE